MRKLIVAAFVSLDGVMQAPGGPSEDLSGGFRFGGWLVPYADQAFGQAIDALFAEPFELLLGRRTYDIFAGYWPRIGAESSDHMIAEVFNRIPKHVATHHPATLEWHNSHGLQGDVREAIGALKRQAGDRLLTQGSSELVQQLLAAGLVDELLLMVHPVLLGAGKRLFGDDAQPAAFSLADSTATPSGVLISRYVRSGEVRTGSFD
ncbi:dihydrofolate reductase family protein [Pseudomonas sp. p1(2021b)]|uniref:dihydrofolate reductase family protein n=1 Tax=Pseudomonas sp. p1(2021b) TaxID=2874628 RepID=UPI001CCD1083|nr:dihydrofolate reductase family protein [Pseudomonas sp. p1(2021b)]UBM26987.1 dihydrofolate reductase family protein [Pseudomonas sp. p1(2021b)]